MTVRRSAVSAFSTKNKPHVAAGLSGNVVPTAGPTLSPDQLAANYQAQAQALTPPALPFAAVNQATHQKQAIDATLQDTLGDVTRQQNQALLDYGYNASFDPSGSLTGLSVDPNNPFSRAALLKRSYDQAQTGATNSLAAQGQLYSGALQNARNRNTFNFQQGSDALQKSLGNLLADLIARRRTALTQANAARVQADDTALLDGLGG